MRPVCSVLIAVSLAAPILATAGCSGGRPAEAATGEQAVAAATMVPVISPRRTTLERTTTQPATVYPNFQARIYAKVAGYLEELRADIGQKVKKGEVLGVISVPEMQLDIETQQMTLQRLRAEEQRAEAGVGLAEAEVTAAQASVEHAAAEVAKAKAELTADRSERERFEELVASKALTQRQLDESSKRFESSRAGKTASEAAVSLAKALVTVAEAKLKTAQSDLLIARATTAGAGKKLEELETMAGYAQLKAPFDGVVTQRYVDPGDLVRSLVSSSEASRQPLFTIVQVETVRARVTVPENDVPWIKEGSTATFRVPALPGKVFDGVVSRSACSLDESTRTMLVEVDVCNPQIELLPGMYGEATLQLEEQKEALVLPAKAVRHDEQGHAFVYVVASDGLVHKTPVTTGLDNGTEIQILSPLEGSEQIVDATVNSLKEGQRVQIARN